MPIGQSAQEMALLQQLMRQAQAQQMLRSMGQTPLSQMGTPSPTMAMPPAQALSGLGGMGGQGQPPQSPYTLGVGRQLPPLQAPPATQEGEQKQQPLDPYLPPQ